MAKPKKGKQKQVTIVEEPEVQRTNTEAAAFPGAGHPTADAGNSWGVEGGGGSEWTTAHESTSHNAWPTADVHTSPQNGAHASPQSHAHASLRTVAHASPRAGAHASPQARVYIDPRNMPVDPRSAFAAASAALAASQMSEENGRKAADLGGGQGIMGMAAHIPPAAPAKGRKLEKINETAWDAGGWGQGADTGVDRWGPEVHDNGGKWDTGKGGGQDDWEQGGGEWGYDDEDEDEEDSYASDFSSEEKPSARHGEWGSFAPAPPAPRGAPTGWKSWGDEARRLPQVTPTSGGTRNVVSPQQRSAILNSLNTLLNNPNQGAAAQHGSGPLPAKGGNPIQPSQAQPSWQALQYPHLFQQDQQWPSQHHRKHGQHEMSAAPPPPSPPPAKDAGKNSKKSKQQQQYAQQPMHVPAQDFGRYDQSKQQQQYAQQPMHVPAQDFGRYDQSEYGVWDEENDWRVPENDEWGEVTDPRRVHFSPKAPQSQTSPSLWGPSKAYAPSPVGPTYDMPSKTLAYAYQGTTTSINNGFTRNQMNEYADVRFKDSKGAGLEPAANAFFGTSRFAKDRIHWMFPSDKDERVVSLLAWIQEMSYNLAMYGLHRFLQSREKGALLTNADYRPADNPSEPAFDWLTFDQLQRTMDRTLQESVAFYDPAVQVIVFVFLPSKSGNSVAIWRRKLKVPNNTRLTYQPEITKALAGLRKETNYVVHVDELPKEESKVAPKAEPRKLIARRFSRKNSASTNVPILSPTSPPVVVEAPKKRKWWHIRW